MGVRTPDVPGLAGGAGTALVYMGQFRSFVGSMIALVVAWVGAPMLFRAARDARRGRS